MFGVQRVWLSTTARNQNPEASAVTLDGAPLVPADGEGARPEVVLPRCDLTPRTKCPRYALGVEIADDQQEVDPATAPPGEPPLKEQLTASFFASSGELESEALVLFDARPGRVAGSNAFRAPAEAGPIDLFVVTRDNRSGTSVLRFRLRAE